MQTVVRCSPRFVQSMVLATVESYHFGTGERRRQGHPSREIYGHIWGHSRIVGGEDPLRFLHLDFLHVQTSSERGPGSVGPNADFLRTAHDIVGRISPEMHLLGDFHTHPYPGTAVGDVERKRLYEFSEPDFDTFHHDEPLWEAAEGAPIMTVATIAELQRVRETEAMMIDEVTCRFDVGRFRIWFRVQGGHTNRINPDDEYDDTTHKSVGPESLELDFEHRLFNNRDTPISLDRDD